jgi:hypothetical protein
MVKKITKWPFDVSVFSGKFRKYSEIRNISLNSLSLMLYNNCIVSFSDLAWSKVWSTLRSHFHLGGALWDVSRPFIAGWKQFGGDTRIFLLQGLQSRASSFHQEKFGNNKKGILHSWGSPPPPIPTPAGPVSWQYWPPKGATQPRWATIHS